MTRIFTFLLLAAALLASCSSDSFKIDGKLDHLDGKAVRIVFNGDSGAVDEWADVDGKGKFSFTGHAAQPALVSVLDHRGNALALAVAVNGDRLTVKGDAGDRRAVKVSGNSLNEQWQEFRDEHADFYADKNPSRLDAAIGKFVRDNPSSTLSTVLLVADHSDWSRAATLLNDIEPQARPASLTAMLAQYGKAAPLPRLMTLRLMDTSGNWQDISLTGHTTVLAMWAGGRDGHDRMASRLKAASSLGDVTRVIDILIDSDTLRWHQAIAADPADRQHYWAPGGPLEPGLQLLHIKSAPWFAVTDSTGKVLYSGTHPTTTSR